jgi:hypothetical protein
MLFALPRRTMLRGADIFIHGVRNFSWPRSMAARGKQKRIPDMRANCLAQRASNVLAAKIQEWPTMLWLYAWATAPYLTQIAIDCVSDILNGRASVVACAQRLAGLAL